MQEEKSKALPTDVRRGLHFRKLMSMPEWQSVAELAEAMMHKWKNNLIQFRADSTVEQLGVDRLMFTSMIKGLEELFKNMGIDIHTMENYEEKEEEEDEKPKKKRRKNPFPKNQYRDK